jgi:hypothetical protein
MIKRQHAGKRAFFIERNERGRWTLRGGFPKGMMRKEPEYREMDIGLQFTSKESLLRHLDELEFCLEGDKVVIDGIHIVRS